MDEREFLRRFAFSKRKWRNVEGTVSTHSQKKKAESLFARRARFRVPPCPVSRSARSSETWILSTAWLPLRQRRGECSLPRLRSFESDELARGLAGRRFFCFLLTPSSSALENPSKRPANSLARLTVILTPEKACWVSLPPPLIGRLLDGGSADAAGARRFGRRRDGKSRSLFLAALSSSSSSAAALLRRVGRGRHPGGRGAFPRRPGFARRSLELRGRGHRGREASLLRSTASDGGALCCLFCLFSLLLLSRSSAPPPRATRVSVSPASADDWEVIQAQAGLLEGSSPAKSAS